MSSPLKVWLEKEGRLLRLRLNRPKANIVDAEMIAALEAALARHSDNADVVAVLLDAEGPNFSFGASVEEHLPDQCTAMLAGLHRLIVAMIEYPVPILIAVRGQCLGGGLEIAMAGHLLFVAPDASLGQPEIRIGVFAPAASCLLPERVSRAVAHDLLFSGRTVGGAEAVDAGLANAVADDPVDAALAYFDRHLGALSTSSLRYAVQAARGDLAQRVCGSLAAVEELYVHGLMATRDAREGLGAFLEKRTAKWENR